LLAAFEAEAAVQARAVLVITDRERAALLRLAPSAPVHVLPVGIDLDEFRPREAASTERRVCFCGVMNYPPNEEAVLWFAREVWPVIRARYPDGRFMIIGSQPTRALRRLPDTASTNEVASGGPHA